MPNNLIAWVYVTIAIGFAWYGAKLSFPLESNILRRLAITWSALFLLIFISPHFLVLCVVAAILFLIVAPSARDERLMYYCAVLPLAPATVGWQIPFPGVGYLIDFYFITFLNLFFLLPLAINVGVDRNKQTPSWTPRSVVVIGGLYLLLIMLLDFRETSITNGLRYALGYTLSFGLILVAFTRVLTNRRSIERVAFGLLLGGVFSSSIGVIQYVADWLIIEQVSPGVRIFGGPIFYTFEDRGAGVRIPSTMGPIPFGMYLAICSLLCIHYLVKAKATRWGYGILLVFLLCILQTDSRGAMLALLASSLFYVFYSKIFVSLRKLIFFSLVAVTVSALVVLDLEELSLELDEHGTFWYRIVLVQNAMDSINNNFWFGTPLFWYNETLNLSRQGQGIIDIVNSYLGVILKYGAVGLALFVVPLWSGIRKLLVNRRYFEMHEMLEDEHLLRCTAAAFFGFALAIVSVGMVDRLPHYYWILMTFSAALIRTSDPVEKQSIEHKRTPKLSP